MDASMKLSRYCIHTYLRTIQSNDPTSHQASHVGTSHFSQGRALDELDNLQRIVARLQFGVVG